MIHGIDHTIMVKTIKCNFVQLCLMSRTACSYKQRMAPTISFWAILFFMEVARLDMVNFTKGAMHNKICLRTLFTQA